ncbi:hypothetical protein [Anaerotignum sp.]|uniref:hypothetical protein n=1 Tax=Anaerotignum sp. TaxID=2039241 RepID=UPI00289BF098|nr:hypothetical protein [Anaerotignum sp.]
MKRVSIAVYGFNIQNDQNQMLDLNSFEEVGLSEVFESFMKDNANKYENISRKEKVFKAEDWNIFNVLDENKRQRYLFMIGKIKTGGYGMSSEIINPETSETNYEKGVGEAEVLPFYFCLAIPADHATRGILILQTIGVYSMKSVFEHMFEKKLKLYNSNHQFITGNLAPRQYIENYMQNGILQRIHLVQYERPVNRDERLEVDFHCKAKELVIHKPVGFITQKREIISGYLTGRRTLTDIIMINDFEFQELKMDFTKGKRTKTINLSNLSKLAITEDITGAISFEGEFPSKESMMEALKSVAEDYMISMGTIA